MEWIHTAKAIQENIQDIQRRKDCTRQDGRCLYIDRVQVREENKMNYETEQKALKKVNDMAAEIKAQYDRYGKDGLM